MHPNGYDIPRNWNLTLTVGSAGKIFHATGWRIGFLIGQEHLVKYVGAAHMRICCSSPSPLQEACAHAYELADKECFWERSRQDMQGKIKRSIEVLDELDLPYTEPDGGYSVLVNFARLKIPAEYQFPEYIASRARDFKLSWFLIVEFGLAAIPPSEFYLVENAHVAEDYLRFAICKDDDVLRDCGVFENILSKLCARIAPAREHANKEDHAVC
jgi:kynurenine aminotransferase